MLSGFDVHLQENFYDVMVATVELGEVERGCTPVGTIFAHVFCHKSAAGLKVPESHSISFFNSGTGSRTRIEPGAGRH